VVEQSCLGGSLLELKKLQKLVDEFINEIGGYWGDSVILARLIEELGEIAHVIQHLKGFRPPLEDATIDLDAELELEMGDLFFVLISLANKRNISLEEALLKVIEKYRRRDLPKWKKILK
jgi:NTP pyrophosphatase (non-canonical NTP hydrolase)